LLGGKPVKAFDDMTVAPVPIELATAAIGAFLQHRLPGAYQFTGPRDVSYAEIARHLAGMLGMSTGLVEPVSAYSAGMPKGSTPPHTTLDSSLLRDTFGIVVPDAWGRLARCWR